MTILRNKMVIHNASVQNLSKINAMINPLVVESLTVNDTTRRRNILSYNVKLKTQVVTDRVPSRF
jgi:hypothetical protein